MFIDINNFCGAEKWHPVLLLLIIWAIYPGTMFLAAWIGESRRLPLGKGQSKMFFPGDLLLGVGIVLLTKIDAVVLMTWSERTQSAFGMVVSFATFLFAVRERVLERDAYDPRSIKSPTKFVHDLMGFFLAPWILLMQGLPALWNLFTVQGALAQTWQYWLGFLAATAGFILCMYYDAKHPATEEEIYLRHPYDWRPIWARQK